jgi:hypothetical protein
MDFDDLDALLDIEADLGEEGVGQKRSLADLQSQREAERSLAGEETSVSAAMLNISLPSTSLGAQAIARAPPPPAAGFL